MLQIVAVWVRLSELREEDVQIDVNRRTGDFEATDLRPAIAGADPTGPGRGIYDPECGNAHLLIVRSAPLGIGVGVLWGEDFENEDGRRGEDTGLRAFPDEDEIGNTDSIFRDAGTPFSGYLHAPCWFVLDEPPCQQRLHTTVFPTSHVALHNLAVDELPVRAIAGFEIFCDGDQNGSGDSILAQHAQV